jgi:hypothetical protein
MIEGASLIGFYNQILLLYISQDGTKGKMSRMLSDEK